ncbi:hypothetical protein CDD83_5172 [Cordyceps sp. RAO-2017]|nr:hypothetical protein CDD83_5172 [Cordyceps sp. RAO-2017]
MPTDIAEGTAKFMRDPIRILVEREKGSLKGIRQFYISTEGDELQIYPLVRVFVTVKLAQCVIFCNSGEEVDPVTQQLLLRHMSVSAAYAKMEESEREASMAEFRSTFSRILVITDAEAHIWISGSLFR